MSLPACLCFVLTAILSDAYSLDGCLSIHSLWVIQEGGEHVRTPTNLSIEAIEIKEHFDDLNNCLSMLVADIDHAFDRVKIRRKKILNFRCHYIRPYLH